jgi:hypothetical protein
MNAKRIIYLGCALIIGLSIYGASFNLSQAYFKVRNLNRTVTVKGLAEKDVKSDLAIWEMNYREVGNDLVQLYQRIHDDQQRVVTFLKERGFIENEIDKTQLRVEDRFANVYSQTNTNTNEQRYVVTGGTRVRSQKVDLVQKSSQEIDQLLQLGIPLTDASTVSPNPSFYFMKLDDVRPSLLSEATKSAYTVAQQFAKDMDCRLGGVQRASQGIFQIMGRDTSTMSADWSSNQNALGSIDKKVRLVTTIEYRIN